MADRLALVMASVECWNSSTHCGLGVEGFCSLSFSSGVSGVIFANVETIEVASLQLQVDAVACRVGSGCFVLGEDSAGETMVWDVVMVMDMETTVKTRAVGLIGAEWRE